MGISMWIGVAIGLLVVIAILLLRIPKLRQASLTRAGIDSRSSDPANTTAPLHLDTNVQFTVYRPSTVVPKREYIVIAFAHLSKRRPDSPDDEPEPVKEVQRLAAKTLSDQPAEYEPTKLDRAFSVPQKGLLTFVPAIEGCEFNPPTQSVQWLKSVHKVEFGMTATTSVDGREVEGEMTVYLGKVLLTEIPMRINVDSKYVVPESQPAVASTAEPYRKIFASYSHKDTEIVEDFEDYGQALGDEYLRDVRTLRSGEVWSEKLEAMIREANVFQLFWSTNSMNSAFVRQEWEYALKLNREKFIRPVYWEEPLPKRPPELPPPALSRLHFYQFINPEEVKRGLGPLELEEHRHSDSGDSSGRGVNRNWFAAGGPMMKALGYASFALIASIVFAPILYLQFGKIIPTASPNPTPFESPNANTNANTNSSNTNTSNANTSNANTSNANASNTNSFNANVSNTNANTNSSNTNASYTPMPTPTPIATPTSNTNANTNANSNANINSKDVRVSIKPPEFDGREDDNSYRIVISNVGSDVISEVEIYERLPDQFEYATSVPAAKRNGQVVLWRIDKIAANGSGSVSVRVKRRPGIALTKFQTLKHKLAVSYVDSKGTHHAYRH